MSELQTLLDQIGKHWGWEVGNKIKSEIEAIVGATNIDLVQLQNAIATIQGLLDADTGTEEFDVGQNIVTQLTDHLARITNLESGVATLKADENTVGSVAYAVKVERDRAVSEETTLQTNIDGVQAELDTTQVGAGLQEDGTYLANNGANYIATATSLKDADDKLDSAIKAVDDARIADKSAGDTAVANAQAKADANETAIATLNGDDTVIGSVAKTAKDTAELASAGAVATAKEYADATFVTKSDITAIDATTLSAMFRSAMDCGFSGATIDDVLNGTGTCADAGAGGGDGAVI